MPDGRDPLTRKPKVAEARVTSLISGPNAGDPEPNATTVINAALEKSWRIIHVAGHGEPPTQLGNASTLVASYSRTVCFLAPGNRGAAGQARTRVRQLLPSRDR